VKRCSKCGAEKDLTEFGKKRNARDGYYPSCKPCTNSYYQRNRERDLKKAKEYAQDNKERRKEYRMRYYQENRSEVLNKVRTYRRENPHRKRKWSATRRAAKSHATPAWADHDAIASKYAMAAWLELTVPGQKYHVDHVIPLLHPLVCGLHVESNLSVVRAEDNLRKHNHFNPEDHAQ
jgi:hypothetical protein